MNILTDEEKKALYDRSYLQPYYWLDGKEFANMIEAAILSKLAEQAGEPVAVVCRLMNCEVLDSTGLKNNWKDLPHGTKLYTEAQLIAAQQKAAEACAKVCEKRSDTLREPACLGDATAIRNGEWREYL